VPIDQPRESGLERAPAPFVAPPSPGPAPQVMIGAPADAPPQQVNLGTMTTRGEVGVLILPLDSLVRMSSNPFFPYMLERIVEGIPSRDKTPADHSAK